MPVLKQLKCHIELNGSNIALREYNTLYHDGFVETFVPVPSACPDGFNIHLTSNGYIAPGLAMFVFMDGVYQCNRNKQGLIIPDGNSPANQTEIDFRVRQKEERQVDGNFVGRAWKFERLNIGMSKSITFADFRLTEHCVASADASSTVNSDVLSNIGTIEVVVLRCKSREDERSFSPLGNSSSATDNGGKEGLSNHFAIRKSTARTTKAASIVAPSDKGSSVGGLFGLFDGSADERRVDADNDFKIGLDGGYPEHRRQHSQQQYNGPPYWVPTGPNQGYYYAGGGAGDLYPPSGANGVWRYPASVYDEYGNRRDAGNAPLYYTTNPYNPYDEYGNRRDVGQAMGENKAAGHQSSRTTSVQGGTRDQDHLAGLNDAFARKGYSNAKWEPSPPSPSWHLHNPRYAAPEPNTAYQVNYNGLTSYPPGSYPYTQNYGPPAQQQQSYHQWQGQYNAHARKPSQLQSTQGQNMVKQHNPLHDKNYDSAKAHGQSSGRNQPENKDSSKKARSNNQRSSRKTKNKHDISTPPNVFLPPSPQSENTMTPLSNNQPFENPNQDWRNSGATMKLSDWRNQNQASGKNDNTSGNPGNGVDQGQDHSGAPQQSPIWGNNDNSGNKGSSNWQNGNPAGENWSGNDPTGNNNSGNDGWDTSKGNNGNAENPTWETNGNQETNNGGDANWGANENNAGASNGQAWDNNNASGNVADSKTGRKMRKDKKSSRELERAFSRGSKTSSSNPHPTAPNSSSNATPQSFIKPYWSNWDKPQTPSDTSTVTDSRRRAEKVYIAPEEPLYRVPEKIARKNNTSHQVQAGRGAKYAHRVVRPAYMDSLNEPYAVFVFKYRSKEILEKMLGITIKEHPDDFRQRMMGLSKEEIVEELLKVKARAGSTAEGDDDNDENNENDENEENDDETFGSEDGGDDNDNDDNNGGNTAWDAQNDTQEHDTGNSAGNWNNSGGGGGDAGWNGGGGGANTAWDAQNNNTQQAAGNSAGDWQNPGGGGGANQCVTW